jgi:hypothetical protein
MRLKQFYTYAEVAQIERRSTRTIEDWCYKDRKLPPAERRFPGAFDGKIPLADIKAKYSLTNDDIKALDIIEDEDDDDAEAVS